MSEPDTRRTANAACLEPAAPTRRAAFEAPFEELPGGFFEVALDAQRIRVGVEIAGLLGLEGDPFAELALDAWSARVHPDDRDALARVFTPGADAPRDLRLDLRLRGPAGDVDVRAERRVLLADGLPARVTGVLVEIRDEARARRAQAESRARLEMLLDHLPRGVLSVHDPESLRFVEVYGRELERLKIAPADLLDQPLEDIYSPASAALISRHCRAAIDEWRPISFENDFGAESYLMHVTPVRTEAGAHLLILSTNVTELREGRDALRQAKERAEGVNAARLAFVAAMSHELRAPLAGILGLLDLLAHDLDLAQAPARIRQLRLLVAGQRRLLDDLLDLALLDVERMHLEVERFTVADVLAPVGERLVGASARGIDATIALPPGDATFVGDPLRVWQVLENLVSNALKYTEAGAIAVEVRLADNGALVLSVADTGLGIADDDLRRIFDSFVRVGEAPRRAAGFGLGLAIVRRLVDKMGGVVAVESAVGVGSTFTAQIPASAEPAAASPPVLGPDEVTVAALAGRRILLVEDDPVLQVIVAELLRRERMIVDEVSDGAAALSASADAEASADADYDAVLMDIGLPDRSGLEVIEELRAREAASGRRRTIVALTGHAQDEDARRSLAAGADAHLSKPVSRRTLLQVLGDLLVEQTDATPARPAQSANSE